MDIQTAEAFTQLKIVKYLLKCQPVFLFADGLLEYHKVEIFVGFLFYVSV